MLLGQNTNAQPLKSAERIKCHAGTKSVLQKIEARISLPPFAPPEAVKAVDTHPDWVCWISGYTVLRSLDSISFSGSSSLVTEHTIGAADVLGVQVMLVTYQTHLNLKAATR
jgi:hypothetical protein